MALAADTIVRIVIDKIIMRDEGGWKLTSNRFDPDGGWTYAGVTAKVFNVYREKKGLPTFTYQGILKAIDEKDSSVIDTVYAIYKEEYYDPLAEYLNGTPHAAEVSCAINCGTGTAKSLTNARHFTIEEFCHNWTAHYVELVVNNARAWMEYAEALEECVKDERQYETVAHQKPSTFRAPNLQGWINRVERYRDGG